MEHGTPEHDSHFDAQHEQAVELLKRCDHYILFALDSDENGEFVQGLNGFCGGTATIFMRALLDTFRDTITEYPDAGDEVMRSMMEDIIQAVLAQRAIEQAAAEQAPLN